MCRRPIGVAASVLAIGLASLTTEPAAADPATTVAYPPNASATRLTGYAFDSCAAPSLAAMQAWKISSPYQGHGIYIGGLSRSCVQPNLTPTWLASTSQQGWRIIPIYVGYQAPCTGRSNAAQVHQRQRSCPGDRRRRGCGGAGSGAGDPAGQCHLWRYGALLLDRCGVP
jgi:hypothetical protein